MSLFDAILSIVRLALNWPIKSYWTKLTIKLLINLPNAKGLYVSTSNDKTFIRLIVTCDFENDKDMNFKTLTSIFPLKLLVTEMVSTVFNSEIQ